MVLITLTGESGSGKTTIAHELIKKSNFKFFTTTTTREKRANSFPNEFEHLTLKKIEKLEQEENFLWVIEYAGNKYAVRYTSLDQAIAAQECYIMILVPEVIPLLRNYTNKVINFFIATLPKEELIKRLQERKETQEIINKRLQNYGMWEQEAKKSTIPYVFIKNDTTIQEAVKQIIANL